MSRAAKRKTKPADGKGVGSIGLVRQEACILAATEEIWRVMGNTETTKADLARALKCSKAHITQLLDGSRNMTLRTFADICHALGHKPRIKLLPNAPLTGAEGNDKQGRGG